MGLNNLYVLLRANPVSFILASVVLMCIGNVPVITFQCVVELVSMTYYIDIARPLSQCISACIHCSWQIARKVFQIWLELKSMRSPKATIDLCLRCSASKEAAEEDVSLS